VIFDPDTEGGARAPERLATDKIGCPTTVSPGG